MPRQAKLSALTALLLAGTCAFPQSDAVELMQQVLMPKEVYVGDEAEIRLSFQSPVDFFALAAPECVTADGISLDTTLDAFTSREQSCTVVRAVLSHTDFSYTLTLTFIPWEPGEIDFDPFDLNEACHIRKEELRENILDIQSVTVTSLSQKLSVTSLRSPASPKLLPGTNYILWALIILALVLLILLALLFVHLPDCMAGLADLRERFGFVRNASGAKRQIRKLLAKKLTDTQTAEEWQHIMRHYLEYRFGTGFGSVATSGIQPCISMATGDLLSGQQEEAVGELSSLFVRTDYIRYAKDAIGSEAAEFGMGEKKKLLEKTLRLIDSLEKQVPVREAAS